MRERGVQMLQEPATKESASISELEMWLHYRPMVTTGDIATLVREGYLLELGADGGVKHHQLTPKGVAEEKKIERARMVARRKKATPDGAT